MAESLNGQNFEQYVLSLYFESCLSIKEAWERYLLSQETIAVTLILSIIFTAMNFLGYTKNLSDFGMQ